MAAAEAGGSRQQAASGHWRGREARDGQLLIMVDQHCEVVEKQQLAAGNDHDAIPGRVGGE